MKKMLFFLFLLVTPLLQADFFKWREGHEFSIGLESFYMDRELKTGTEMDGGFTGFRGSYDHIAPDSLYWGFEAAWLQGPLDGSRSNGAPQRADVWEADVEARIGYTINFETNCQLQLVPFVGYHYYRGHFRFIPPSQPFPEAEDYVHAASFGFFLRGEVHERVQLTLDFRTRYMFDGLNTLKGVSAMFPFIERPMGNDFHYVVQLPIDVKLCEDHEKGRLRIMPFYRYRNYDSWESSPANFNATCFHNYGLALQLWYPL